MKKVVALAAMAAPVALVAALSLPSMAYAQSDSGLTRQQVRSELARLEKAGYNPSANSINYPENIQAAEARANGAPANAVQGVVAGRRGQ